MRKVHLIISGFVQGVAFRQFIKKTAEDLDLTGWVRNTGNNKVEAVFEGEEGNIKNAADKCKKGPFLAEVEDIQLEWIDDEKHYPQFKIIRD